MDEIVERGKLSPAAAAEPEQNVGVLEIQLTAEDLRRIDEAAPQGVAADLRYPETRIINLMRSGV